MGGKIEAKTNPLKKEKQKMITQAIHKRCLLPQAIQAKTYVYYNINMKLSWDSLGNDQEG